MSSLHSSILFRAVAECALRDVAPGMDPVTLEASLRRMIAGPPLRGGGAEVHLSDGRVDLQQHVRRDSDEWTEMAQWVHTPAAAQWCENETIVRCLQRIFGPDEPWVEAWLERDGNNDRALGVFIGFGHEESRSNDERLALIADRFELDDALRGTLRALCAHWNTETYVHFAGLFVGRESATPTVRINLRGAWPTGSSQWLPAALHHALRSAPCQPSARTRTILALDITAAGIVRAGVEATPNVESPDPAAWFTWFDHLALPEHAVLAAYAIPWPRSIVSEEGTPWPLPIILDGARRSMRHFPMLQRRLSHLKQTPRSDGSLETKLYLSFSLAWVTPDG